MKSNSRKLRKEATRSAILQSALLIFSERGFDGASTRDIAAHTGVHHALINYYFDNKDKLWRAAVSFLFERQAAEMSFGGPAGNLKTRKKRRAPRGRSFCDGLSIDLSLRGQDDGNSKEVSEEGNKECARRKR